MKSVLTSLASAGLGLLFFLDATSLAQTTPRPVAIPAYPVEGIDYKPLPAIYAAVARGAVKEASIEIINRKPEPLEITGIENPGERFAARIETLEPGKRFRLIVTAKGEGPGGDRRDILLLKTNLPGNHVMKIPVNTKILEKVYFFPPSVFVGRYSLSQIKDPVAAEKMAQILMVYRKGIPGFEIKLRSDIPFLKFKSELGPNKDQWENWVSIDSSIATPGEIKGTIFIETNDPDFPKLTVPVTGRLLPN